mmetsp:Transcript_1881/g.4168  ORF Transcript_1881/g.4168 Transcript_1881/m.4168 type:complete len:209 (+) Transcript_1881:785-1411(+)
MLPVHRNRLFVQLASSWSVWRVCRVEPMPSLLPELPGSIHLGSPSRFCLKTLGTRCFLGRVKLVQFVASVPAYTIAFTVRLERLEDDSIKFNDLGKFFKPFPPRSCDVGIEEIQVENFFSYHFPSYRLLELVSHNCIFQGERGWINSSNQFFPPRMNLFAHLPHLPSKAPVRSTKFCRIQIILTVVGELSEVGYNPIIRYIMNAKEAH